MEIQAEEGKLDQLATQARKRRQKNHEMLTKKLLEERRCLRATLKLKAEEENLLLENYNNLQLVFYTFQ